MRDQILKTLKTGRLHPLWEATETFLFRTGVPTRTAPHARDALDMKRVMIVVVAALIPCTLMALYNTGWQANASLVSELGRTAAEGWRGMVMGKLGLEADPGSLISNMVHGALYFLPVYLVCFMVGSFWEVLFAVVRRQEISEGFLVTSLLFALILPPTIPLWQVALGISFGVVLGKEVFGGIGMNIFNPALVGRAFLYFAYPAESTGDGVWVAVDGITRATPLARFEKTGELASGWLDAFMGFIPGSMGETSTLACLIGAAVLILTGIGSWRVMVSVCAGMAALSLFFNMAGSGTNEMFAMSPLWHLVLGGFAFGTVFMATDPVSSANTEVGQYVYGFLIGTLTVLIRVVNPAYTEGIMLAILFSNIFAPVIDKAVVAGNIRRRRKRIGN